MKMPWSKDDECEHLVKYQERSIDIGGVTIPNLFTIGNVSIKPEVLQATKEAIQILDMTHFNNCKTLKMAPNEESKNKYFEEMTIQQKKLNDIATAIAAYSTNPNSQKLEETLAQILKSNLAIPDSSKEKINKMINVDISQKDIEAESVKGSEIGKISNGTVKASQEKIKAKEVTGAKVDEIG